MELVDFKYTKAAILIVHSYRLYRAYDSLKEFAKGQRYATHFFYDTPDDHRIIAAEIRRLRANERRLAA